MHPPSSIYIFAMLLAVLVILVNQGRLLRLVESKLLVLPSSDDDERYHPVDTTAPHDAFSSALLLARGASSGAATGISSRLDPHHHKQEDSTTLLLLSKEEDQDCPFRDSPLYRSVFVYPSPNDNDEWKGDILSEYGVAMNATSWPWIDIDQHTRTNGTVHYDPTSQSVQYTTELLVRDILTHPASCLRTYNPDNAKLFYVPYLPSVEYHKGSSSSLGDYKTSPFGQALMDATGHGDYRAWESTFGLTSRYWQRRKGADHILVFSEPLHGLYHPKSKRGSFHFIHTQKQLTPPIVISVELSRTFVEKYPHCARKNILMPYPNTDGNWFNGVHEKRAKKLYQAGLVVKAFDDSNSTTSPATLPAELELFSSLFDGDHTWHQQEQEQQHLQPRPLAQFYKGGNHGTCTRLRKALQTDFRCTESARVLKKAQEQLHNKKKNKKNLDDYTLAYRQATFCPCPGGDSPSAKRMFDALHAGCIPLILSHDFVWPFSPEFDTIATTTTTTMMMNGITTNTSSSPTTTAPQLLDPNVFSIRLKAEDYQDASYNEKCEIVLPTKSSGEDDDDTNSSTTTTSSQQEEQQQPQRTRTIQQFLEETISSTELLRLRQGVHRAADHYAYYKRRPDLPLNPLQERVLPDGGAAHALVQALAERAEGVLWPACQRELEQGSAKPKQRDARAFRC